MNKFHGFFAGSLILFRMFNFKMENSQKKNFVKMITWSTNGSEFRSYLSNGFDSLQITNVQILKIFSMTAIDQNSIDVEFSFESNKAEFSMNLTSSVTSIILKSGQFGWRFTPNFVYQIFGIVAPFAPQCRTHTIFGV